MTTGVQSGLAAVKMVTRRHSGHRPERACCLHSLAKLSRFSEESKVIEFFSSVNLVGLLKDQMPCN